jgi:hypothetical protein
MSESSTDELRLRATEAQMRRALGLGDQPSSAPELRLSSAPPGTAHPHRRHFARDGEVPVTVLHHDDGAGTNKLDAARQSLREQIAAREQTKRFLEEARVTVKDLQTKLAHERIAAEEAVRRAEDEQQAIERQLEEELAARQKAEQERDEAIAARQEAEERLREIMAGKEAQKHAMAPRTGRKARATIARSDASELATPIRPATRSADETATMKQAGRRGRPPKVREGEPEFVEWWLPGWKERFR